MLDLIWHVTKNDNDFLLFMKELLIKFGGIPDVKKAEESFSERYDKALNYTIEFLKVTEGDRLKIFGIKLILVGKFLLIGGNMIN